MTAYHLVWAFTTDSARRERFEAAYGPAGVWAEFFRKADEYLGTELVRESEDPPRYLTVDRWRSRDAYQRFRQDNLDEYERIDNACAALTTEETFLGDEANVERYQRWYAYERNAHALTLASLHTVPEPARGSTEYRKACGLMAHLAMARRLWLFRFGEPVEPPAEFFPDNHSLAEITAELTDIEARWEAYLARLTDGELTRVFTYRSLEGPRFRNSVEDILTQLFGHSWYHRGQIAQLARALGGVPAETDFVFWTREPLEDLRSSEP